MRVAIYGESAFAEALRVVLLEQGHMLSTIDTASVVWLAGTAPLDASGLPLPPVFRLPDGASPAVPILISTEWPVGTMAEWQRRYPAYTFFYVMENVRAQHAVEDLRNMRWVIGDGRYANPMIGRLLGPAFYTSFESAEMTKHAINTLMALQIAFTNEIRDLCCMVDASADDVMTGVRMDRRVSNLAPLMPGGPFDSPCLTREVRILETLGEREACETPIISAILRSNAQ